MKPLSDRIFVEIETPPQTGIILMPDTMRTKQDRGKVVRCGPGRTTSKGVLIPMSLKVGDRVLFENKRGTEQENGKFILMHEADVLARLE